MHRQPRRMNPHPRYQRGMRLRADQVRSARQQGGGQARAAEAVMHQPAPSVPRIRPVAPPKYKPATGRRRVSIWRALIIGVPLTIFLIVGAYMIPLLLETKEAADKIFQENVDRPIISVTDNGTPVIEPSATQQVDLPDWDKKERVNIVLLGVDDRRDGEVPRSDTMIIVTIDPANKKVGMLSIPRDLLVTIPSYGDDKINAAYPVGSQSELGGPALVIATIEYNFEIPIHYYAEVDFHGFEKIVDTLGGVTLDVQAPIKDDEYPGEDTNYTRIVFHTGLQHMSGKTALRYARTRHDDNDFARGDRQQEVLRAMREQGIQLNLITKAPELVSNLGDTVRTDLSPGESIALAKLGTEIKSEDIQSYNLLSAVTEQWIPGEPYYLIPDWNGINQILDEMQIREGTSEAQAPPSGEQPAPAATVDTSANVLVQNGTFVNLLASGAAGRLQESGFISVSTEQSPTAGSHPRSEVIYFGGQEATARRIVEVLRLPESALVVGDPASGSAYDVVVVLGDDAPVE